MANNIFVGPNSCVSKVTQPFSSIAGINANTIEIIYEVGAVLKSFVPGRTINGITGVVADKGYYVVAKQNVDLTTVFFSARGC